MATAAMNESEQSAWCRAQGLYPTELARWRQDASDALVKPGEAKRGSRQNRQDKLRIQTLERELAGREKALAETAALLVLSKKLVAIFPEGADA